MQTLFNSSYLGVGPYLGQAPHAHAAPGLVGVLLCNLGTPAAPTPRAVRRYLAEFLSDPRLIELPRWLWLPLLHGVILNVRPRRSAHAYGKIWTAEGSPLLALSRALHAAVGVELSAAYGDRVQAALAMRYGQPSIASALEHLRAAKVRRLLVLPLYPQYSGPATGSVFDAVTAVLQRWRWVPDLRFIASYHDEPAHISAVARSITEQWQRIGRGEKLFFSFHGLPHKVFMQGDPYFCHCHATARLVAQTLGLEDSAWQVVFQSRFGRARWLQPYADLTLQAAARGGARIVDVVCPGFAVDCLETLEEIALQNRALFIQAGGHELRYIPALNARPDHVAALTGLIRHHLTGWPECDREWDAAASERVSVARVARAKALGAAS